MDPLVYIAVGVAQILAILGGGGVVAYRIGRSTERVELISSQAVSSIAELKVEVSALKTLMTEVALQKAAIDRLEKWYDELRRGEGLIRRSPKKT
jgi:hypothetical protein